MPHGKFYWNELVTNDVDAARRACAAAFGWSFDAMPMEHGGTYWIAKVGDDAVAGIMAMQGILPEGTPPHWIGYVAVDDLDACLATFTQQGGRMYKEPFDVPGVGRIGFAADPTGAMIGLITPANP